ncbi:MAG: IreB family regulatory phosphoprotein [Firmicutes bacterium]|nr:IreB family regulatory phosphoprotein [Bacillota bacterium]
MLKDRMEETQQYSLGDETAEARKILESVFRALQEKGYNPIHQLVGYLLSGDPAYITNHMGARNKIRQLERDEILEELIRTYLLRK